LITTKHLMARTKRKFVPRKDTIILPECSVCHEILIEPYVFPCAHHVCIYCAQTINRQCPKCLKYCCDGVVKDAEYSGFLEDSFPAAMKERRDAMEDMMKGVPYRKMIFTKKHSDIHLCHNLDEEIVMDMVEHLSEITDKFTEELTQEILALWASKFPGWCLYGAHKPHPHCLLPKQSLIINDEDDGNEYIIYEHHETTLWGPQ